MQPSASHRLQSTMDDGGAESESTASTRKLKPALKRRKSVAVMNLKPEELRAFDTDSEDRSEQSANGEKEICIFQ